MVNAATDQKLRCLPLDLNVQFEVKASFLLFALRSSKGHAMKLSTLFLLSMLGAGLCSNVYPPARAQISTMFTQPGASRTVARVETQDALPSTQRFRLDAAQSRFMVRTFSGGLLWFKGHDHFIAVRDFTGEAQLTPVNIVPASLQFTVRADSLVETRDVFTEQQKQIINKEIRELVLETGKYPEIVFRSTDVSGKQTSAGQYEAQISGDLTLHGVTRHVVIPALVTLAGRDLRARGEFVLKRSDYNVKATSALHGTIRVRDKLKLIFEIVAHQD
jgi:polyisoprenoid-binding protein YceI